MIFTQRQSIGFAGIASLIIGVFAPLASVPFLGSVTYIGNGHGDGVFVLAGAILCAVLLVLRRQRTLFVVANAVIALLLFTGVRIVAASSEVRQQLANQRDNPLFGGLSEVLATSIQIQWGFALLLLGATLILVAAVGSGESRTLDTATKVGAGERGIGLPILAFGATLPLVGIATALLHHTSDNRLLASAGEGWPASWFERGEAPQIDSALAADLERVKNGAHVGGSHPYVSRVLVSNLHVADDALGEPGVFGEVKNAGNRTLDEVEITIFFLDASGRPVHETTYTPVLVSRYGFEPGQNQPLKPGYSRRFGVRASNAPSEWARHVRVSVSSVRFAGDSLR